MTKAHDPDEGWGTISSLSSWPLPPDNRFEQADYPRHVTSTSELVAAITALAGEHDVPLASILEVRLVKRSAGDGKTEHRLIVGRALES
jgi:hypothetical protein